MKNTHSKQSTQLVHNPKKLGYKTKIQVTRGKSRDNITFVWIQNEPLQACHSTEEQEYTSLIVKMRLEKVQKITMYYGLMYYDHSHIFIFLKSIN